MERIKSLAVSLSDRGIVPSLLVISDVLLNGLGVPRPGGMKDVTGIVLNVGEWELRVIEVHQEGVCEVYGREKKFAELEKRSDDITFLEEYSNFLEEHHYLDTDWWAEEPFAIDEFLKKKI